MKTKYKLGVVQLRQIKVLVATEWLRLIEDQQYARDAYYDQNNYINRLSAPPREVYLMACDKRDELIVKSDKAKFAIHAYFKTALLILDPDTNIDEDGIPCGRTMEHVSEIAKNYLSK